MSARLECPEAQYLEMLEAGGLTPNQEERWEQHLSACTACRERLDRAAQGKERLLHLARQFGDPTMAVIDPQLSRIRACLHDLKVPVRSDRVEPADLYFLRPTDRPDLLGTLGDYEVQEVIGQGGMGVVLKAFDPALHRLVAIKVVAPVLAGSATARRRFSREAQAAAAVCHDHVVAVHGVHEADGLPYLVMQYVAGESLQARLDRQGPLDVEEVVRIGFQTASGLAAAHAQGLIHRDIKPANLLLEDGLARVKITDFGLARMTDDVGLTQAGVVAGTPEYMAPEQARGEPVDPRADLFSLGCVLYATCTGLAPFRGPSALAVLHRVNEQVPTPIRWLNPDVPAWLDSFIARLLAKDPADRLQSAAEVAGLLERYLAHLRQPEVVPAPELTRSPLGVQTTTPVPSRPVKRFPRRYWLPALVLLLLLGLGSALWLAQGVKRSDAEPAEAKKYPKEVYFDFRGKLLPPELTVKPDRADRFVKSEPEGLRVTLPKNRKNLAPFDLIARVGVQGDFEITATIEILQAEQPLEGFGVGASLFINKVDPPTEAASVGRLLRPSGEEILFWDQGFGKPGEQLQFDFDSQPCREKLLRLRLERTGSKLAYFLGGGLTGEKFEELQPKNFGRNDIEQVIMRVTTGRQPHSVDARLIDLRIRSGRVPDAEELPVAAVARALSSRMWLVAALLLGLAITLCFLVAFGLRRRRGAATEGSDVPRQRRRTADKPDHPQVAAEIVRFPCAGCGKTLNARPDLAGKKVKCSQCDTVVTVPESPSGGC